MDDFHRDGFPPRRGILGDFHDRPDTRANTNPTPKKQRQGRSAADLRLPHDILSRLSHRGSHPSEWELITREEALYNLRASDHIAIFRRTRKGWEPLKAINGVPTGEEIIALRRRSIPKRSINHGSALSAAEQFAYDDTVSQVFFHRRLSANASLPPGYQPRHISLREWDSIMETAVPTKPVNHWVGLVLRDADGQPVAGYPYRLRDSSGAIRQGQLNAQGESQVNGLADGPVDITFGQPVEDPAIQTQRQQVKQELERILQAEREEAARIESEHRQRSLLGKAMAYQSALSKGTGEALWGILSGVKELTDLSTQHLNNALGAAWETWRHADEERYLQTFLENFQEAEFQELIDVLGIDPRSITREQWAEAQSLLNFLWHDDETQAQLIDFAKDYVDAQHGLEIAETGAGMLTEIAVDILITALTLGMGATLVVTTKVRHVSKLGTLGKALKQLAQKLKQRAGSKQAQSQTGTWLYEDLEKPDHKTIEPRDGPDGGEYDAVVEEMAPDKTYAIGARDIPVDEYLKREAWATEQYDYIRLSDTDVADITSNLGIPEFQVQRVKDHLFLKEHTFRDGDVGLFDADADIVEAWQRMQQGTHTVEDMQLFKHEHFESRFEGIFRTDYGTAHDKTQLRYPSPLDNY